MPAYDWLVCGAGITGLALSYELQVAGFRVLLIERHRSHQGASRFSYGGVSYWSSTTKITQTLSQEALQRYPHLGTELDHPTGFREIDLLLTIDKHEEIDIVSKIYQDCFHPPQYLDIQSAQEKEPLLNADHLQGVLWCNHAQVDPENLCHAYREAFVRHGGEIIYAEVQQFLQGTNRIKGVITDSKNIYQGGGIIICAGGMGRQLLNDSGITVPLFFTHTELIELPEPNLDLRCFILPANLQRMKFEVSGAAQLSVEKSQEIMPASLDPGAVPLLDGRIRLGQISRLHPDPNYQFDAQESEGMIRSAIAKILPTIAFLPGNWHHCLAAFCQDALPLIGDVKGHQGIYLFTGFTSPMMFVPPLAKRFAKFLLGSQDEIIKQFSPDRFAL